MSRPVLTTHFGNLSITRAKLLFVEQMTTDPGLKPLELRLGIALLTAFTAARGYGETSIEHVADALGANKGNLSRAANALERKGYFRIERASYRHGIRGKPNRYFPNWEKVPSLQPINAAAAARKVVSGTTFRPTAAAPLGCLEAPNKVVPATTNPDSSSLNKSCAHQRAPRTEARVHDAQHEEEEVALKEGKKEHQENCAFLRRTDAFLRAPAQRPFTPKELETLHRWSWRCREIWEATELGDPINGWSMRIGSELEAILVDYQLDPDAPIDPPPEPKRANGHANDDRK